MEKFRAKNRLVYSTEGLVTDPEKDQSPGSRTTGRTIYIKREVKGRSGKTVTTVNCTNWPEDRIKELAAELKKYCGSGGSVKKGIIILQGDQRQKIFPFLTDNGYQVILAGG
jgi:translation initiation factor 1